MGIFKKIFSSLIAVTLLVLPVATVQGEETSAASHPISSSQFSVNQVLKEQSLNPADYPLKKDGEAAGTLRDSFGSQYITFQKVVENTVDKMDVQLLYRSDQSTKKAPIVSIEFYKLGASTLQYLGYTQFDTYGATSGLMQNFIAKTLYKDQPYIYLRVGITANPDDAVFTDAIMFKVANPFNTSQSPIAKKYAIISNESVLANQSEYTGTFSINNDQYSFNKNLTPEAYQMDYLKPFDLGKNQSKQLSKNSIHKPSLAALVGDTKDFWVTNIQTNTPYQINAKLLYTGTKANVWVNNNLITSQDAIKLGTEFDSKIYSSVTNNFGVESDVNGDGKINILCFDIQDGFNGSGGYIGGYFYGGDLFNIANSNQSEIFYMDTYPAMGTSATKDVTQAYTTLAHEFQHMVNFNQTAFVEKSTTNMDVWLNEGLSMAAEQIYTGKALTSRINYYNATGSTAAGHSLLYWDATGDTLANYSLSYLFSQYVKLQANKGNGIFKEILLDKSNDYKSVENVVKKYINPTLSFGKFMTNFRGALLLKQATGAYGFKGVPEFNQLQPKLYSGPPGYLRGGGAVVKPITGDFAIPVNKGTNVTYTIVQEASPVDKTPPAKPNVNPVSDKDLAITGKAEVSSMVYVKRGSVLIGSATAGGTGAFTVKIAKQKAGTKLTIYAVDKAKNKGPDAFVTVIDKTAPASPAVNEVKDNSKVVSGKAEIGSRVTVKKGKTVLGVATADKFGKFSITLKTLQKAKTVLAVTVTDKANNPSKATYVTVKDRTAPGVPKVNKVTKRSTSVTGKAEPSAKVYVKLGSKIIGSATTDKKGNFKVKIKKQKAGKTISVYAKDGAGNTSKSAKLTVKK